MSTTTVLAIYFALSEEAAKGCKVAELVGAAGERQKILLML